jgi:hypothetical protein
VFLTNSLCKMPGELLGWQYICWLSKPSWRMITHRSLIQNNIIYKLESKLVKSSLFCSICRGVARYKFMDVSGNVLLPHPYSCLFILVGVLHWLNWRWMFWNCVLLKRRRPSIGIRRYILTVNNNNFYNPAIIYLFMWNSMNKCGMSSPYGTWRCKIS